MKLLIDFFPIILFFLAFKLWGIYAATAVAIAATLAQIAYLRWRSGKVEPMQWVSLVIIVVFGGATLFLQDESFIKFKPSALYWLMGAVLVFGQLVLGKNFIQILMGKQLELPARAWRTLNWSWSAFFLLMGALNLWVAQNFDTETWVNFKMFGGIGLMLVFIFAQAIYMSRFMQEKKET